MLSLLFPHNPRLTFAERAVSVGLGLGIAAAGATPRPNPLFNLVALAAGSYLAYRGATGYCPVTAALTDGEEERPTRIRNRTA